MRHFSRLAVILTLVTFALGITASANAAGAFYAKSATWSTQFDILAGASPVSWTLADPQCVATWGPRLCPGTAIAAPAGGAAIAPETILDGFGILPAPAAADFVSVLSFDDGKTNATLPVPELEPITTETVRLGVITNTASVATYLAAVNTGSSPVWLSYRVHDGTGAQAGGDSIRIAPGGFSFTRIAATVAAGSVEVFEGCLVGIAGCDVRTPVYGFVTVGPVAGTTAPRVMAFK